MEQQLTPSAQADYVVTTGDNDYCECATRCCFMCGVHDLVVQPGSTLHCWFSFFFPFLAGECLTRCMLFAGNGGCNTMFENIGSYYGRFFTSASCTDPSPPPSAEALLQPTTSVLVLPCAVLLVVWVCPSDAGMLLPSQNQAAAATVLANARQS